MGAHCISEMTEGNSELRVMHVRLVVTVIVVFAVLVVVVFCLNLVIVFRFSFLREFGRGRELKK